MKATVNGGKPRVVNLKNDAFEVEGKPFPVDFHEIRPGRYHIIHNLKTYAVEVLSSDIASHLHTVRVNGKVFEVQLRDHFDELLQELGMDVAAGKKAGDLKAPMPGLVVNVLVEEGQQIHKGDTLVVLEAMKMENSLKASADAVIKKINVTKGNTVEKNQVLIQLG